MPTVQVSKILSFSFGPAELAQLLSVQNLPTIIEYFPYMLHICRLIHPETGDNLMHIIKQAAGLTGEQQRYVKFIIEYINRNHPELNSQPNKVGVVAALPMPATTAADSDAKIAYCEALQRGNWDEVHRYLDAGVQAQDQDLPNSLSSFMNSSDPLSGDDEQLKKVLWAMVRVIYPEALHKTSVNLCGSIDDFLCRGIENQAYLKILILICAGIDPFAPRPGGWAVWKMAIYYNNINVLEWLDKTYGLINPKQPERQEPLKFAIRSLAAASLRFLIEKGYNLDETLVEQLCEPITSLPFEASESEEKAVASIIDLFSIYNINCDPLLPIVMQSSKHRLLDKICGSSSNPSLLTVKVSLPGAAEQQDIPLVHYAALLLDYTAVRVLHKYGIDINMRCNVSNRTVADMVALAAAPEKNKQHFLQMAVITGSLPQWADFTHEFCPRQISKLNPEHLNIDQIHAVLSAEKPTSSYSPGYRTVDNTGQENLLKLKSYLVAMDVSIFSEQQLQTYFCALKFVDLQFPLASWPPLVAMKFIMTCDDARRFYPLTAEMLQAYANSMPIPHIENQPLIHAAVINKDEKFLRILLDHRHDINVRDISGHTIAQLIDDASSAVGTSRIFQYVKFGLRIEHLNREQLFTVAHDMHYATPSTDSHQLRSVYERLCQEQLDTMNVEHQLPLLFKIAERLGWEDRAQLLARLSPIIACNILLYIDDLSLRDYILRNPSGELKERLVCIDVSELSPQQIQRYFVALEVVDSSSIPLTTWPPVIAMQFIMTCKNPSKFYPLPPEMLQAYAQAMPKPHVENQPLVHTAVQNEDDKFLKILLAHGHDINERDANGNTIVMLIGDTISLNGSIRLCKYLQLGLRTTDLSRGQIFSIAHNIYNISVFKDKKPLRDIYNRLCREDLNTMDIKHELALVFKIAERLGLEDRAQLLAKLSVDTIFSLLFSFDDLSTRNFILQNLSVEHRVSIQRLFDNHKYSTPITEEYIAKILIGLELGLDTARSIAERLLQRNLGSDYEKVAGILECPIGRIFMYNPLLAPSGHSFEADIIKPWLKINQINPMTQSRLRSMDLKRNQRILDFIKYLLSHPQTQFSQFPGFCVPGTNELLPLEHGLNSDLVFKNLLVEAHAQRAEPQASRDLRAAELERRQNAQLRQYKKRFKTCVVSAAQEALSRQLNREHVRVCAHREALLIELLQHNEDGISGAQSPQASNSLAKPRTRMN